MGCRVRIAHSQQGSSSRSWPRSLSREVSVRSATLWFDLLLLSYNFHLIIMMNCHFFQKYSPRKCCPFRKQASLIPAPSWGSRPPRRQARAGTRSPMRARTRARCPASGWPYRITKIHRHHFIRCESHIHLSMKDK